MAFTFPATRNLQEKPKLAPRINHTNHRPVSLNLHVCKSQDQRTCQRKRVQVRWYPSHNPAMSNSMFQPEYVLTVPRSRHHSLPKLISAVHVGCSDEADEFGLNSVIRSTMHLRHHSSSAFLTVCPPCRDFGPCLVPICPYYSDAQVVLQGQNLEPFRV